MAMEEPPLTITYKLRLFMAAHWRGVICLVLPIILVPVLLPFPPEKYQWCAYTLFLMAIFWVSECIPLTITSFIPMMIFPISGVMSTEETCKCYINDSVVMFVGTLMMAYSIEQSGFHKRLAYCAIRMIGYSHYKLLLAMCAVTTFVSFWITNTAATTMMVPINFEVLKVFEDQNIIKVYEVGPDGQKFASDITTCYFCAASFSATIGGVATLVGTATNLVFKGLFMDTYPAAPEYLSFPKFTAFALPYMIVNEACLYIYLCIVYFGLFRPGSAAAKSSKISDAGKAAAKKVIDADWIKMGKLTYWELMVIIMFLSAIIVFFCRSPQIYKGWGDIIEEHFGIKDAKFIRDSALAMLVVFLMCFLPSTLDFFKNCTAKFYEDLPKGPVPSVLNWRLMNARMPYNFMFLLGGGFALSKAAKVSGLNEHIGQFVHGLKTLPNIVVLLIIVLSTSFVTQFASNVAVCNVFVPIAMQVAKEIHQNPLWYNIAAGFTSSYCFMVPVGTPGNLIVQNAARIPTIKMVIAGSGPTVFTSIITWLAVYFYAPIIWPELHTMPDWVNG